MKILPFDVLTSKQKEVNRTHTIGLKSASKQEEKERTEGLDYLIARATGCSTFNTDVGIDGKKKYSPFF